MIEVMLCLVVAITDGDTLKVRCDVNGGYQERVIRLAEIDAPEKKQPFGERSKQALSDLCFKKQVRLNAHKSDRYGRTVARVFCDNVDTNKSQVASGMAMVYDKYVTDQSLYAVQDRAKNLKLGLWSQETVTPPWEWRSAKKPPQPRFRD